MPITLAPNKMGSSFFALFPPFFKFFKWLFKERST